MPKSIHYCHALSCKVPVPPRMLMCLRHWKKVPRDVQSDVWKYYRPGQEQDKQPTVDYVSAALSAIFAVADKEKVDYDPQAIIRDAAIKLASGKSAEQLQQLIEEAGGDRK